MGLFDKPKAADPKMVADTQAGYNHQAAVDWTKLNAAGANHSGPFGSTTTQVDANGMPTGQTAALDPSLNAGGVANAFGGQVNNLGTGQFNWDTMTAPAIAQGNYGAYAAMTAPQRQQQQNALKTTLAERGIPLGSEIEQNETGNLNRQFSIADQNAAAQAWNAVPGMQSQLQSNEIQQQMAPGMVAGQSLGLIGGLAGLTPGFMNTAPPNIAPGNFAGAQAQADQQNAQNWQNTWSGIGNLASVGMGGLFGQMPKNWSFGNTPAGALYGGATSLFNTK